MAACAQELKELIASYQTLRESGRGPAICNTIIETARQCNLDKDIQLPEEDAKDLDLAQRDSLVGQAYSRSPPLALLPCLYTISRPLPFPWQSSLTLLPCLCTIFRMPLPFHWQHTWCRWPCGVNPRLQTHPFQAHAVAANAWQLEFRRLWSYLAAKLIVPEHLYRTTVARWLIGVGVCEWWGKRGEGVSQMPVVSCRQRFAVIKRFAAVLLSSSGSISLLVHNVGAQNQVMTRLTSTWIGLATL